MKMKNTIKEKLVANREGVKQGDKIVDRMLPKSGICVLGKITGTENRPRKRVQKPEAYLCSDNQ